MEVVVSSFLPAQIITELCKHPGAGAGDVELFRIAAVQRCERIAVRVPEHYGHNDERTYAGFEVDNGAALLKAYGHRIPAADPESPVAVIAVVICTENAVLIAIGFNIYGSDPAKVCAEYALGIDVNSFELVVLLIARALEKGLFIA